MTDDREHAEDRAALAGEFALGLLTGAELRDARALAVSDPVFAKEIARWRGRMVPLLEEVDAAHPPERVWSKIESQVANKYRGANVIVLQLIRPDGTVEFKRRTVIRK